MQRCLEGLNAKVLVTVNSPHRKNPQKANVHTADSIKSSCCPKQPNERNEISILSISIVIGRRGLTVSLCSFLIPFNTLSSHRRGLPYVVFNGSGRP